VDKTHPNRPETDTALMSDNKHSNALEITKIMGKRPIVLSKGVDETHSNRPETDTAMSDTKHSHALEITKIMGKKAHCFTEESG